MWRLMLLGCLLGIAACEAKAPAPQGPATAAFDHSKNLSIGCYTVDLFDPYKLKKPEGDVTPENARFIGVWKDAAWNGEWCHDLYITEVRADGTVTLLDAYGPYRPQNREATVFKREARINSGTLRFTAIGAGKVSYRLSEDGQYLIGKRRDFGGEYTITMVRHDGIAIPVSLKIPPIPPKRPRYRS